MTVAHLSNVYRFTEQFGIIGHRIGRKVGDMLEVVVMACLYRDDETRRRMLTEPKVEGFTGAGHKVEFAFYAEADPDKCVGLVECKKVGVEVTTHGKTKNGPIVLSTGQSITQSMRPKWVEKPLSPKLTYLGGGKLEVATSSEEHTFAVREKSRIKVAITADGKYAVLGPKVHLASITKNIGACQIYTVRACDDQQVAIHIDTCLTGPQTIEKAKQIAWVALDVRKKECGHWGKEDVPPDSQDFISVLVVGEASHWEEKSRQVVRAALDYNLAVDDAVIVELFQAFIDKFGQADFESMISKDKYVKNSTVRRIVDEIISAKDEKVMSELDTGVHHTIRLRNDRMVVEPLD